MRLGRGVLCALALAFAASLAARAAEPSLLDGRPPIVSVRSSPVLTNGAEQLDVFAARGSAPRFVARRTDLLDGRPTAIRWADSATCPKLIAQLKAMTAIRLQPAVIEPLDPPPPGQLPQAPSYRPDGVVVTLRTRARSADGDGGFGELTVSGNWGPWVSWAADTSDALEPCWSGTEPATTTGG